MGSDCGGVSWDMYSEMKRGPEALTSGLIFYATRRDRGRSIIRSIINAIGCSSFQAHQKIKPAILCPEKDCGFNRFN